MNIKGKLPQRVGGTRWIPHMKKALAAVFRGYAALIGHLENQSHTVPKADGLARMLRDYNVMAFAVLLQV
jgi:hypothetical protein